LIMPDAPIEVASAEGRGGASGGLARREMPAALAPANDGGERESLESFAKRAQQQGGGLADSRGRFQDGEFDKLGRRLAQAEPSGGSTAAQRAARDRLEEAKQLKSSLDFAYGNYRGGQWRANQVSKLGVDLAICTNSLKCQTQLQATAIRRVAQRNCMEYGGVWIDEAFTAKTPTLAIKAQSDAYFRILERRPNMKDVFGLGNHIVWITPNGTGLIIDTTSGKDTLSDREIDMLFVAK
jgi:Ca-activated chloride channel family protein